MTEAGKTIAYFELFRRGPDRVVASGGIYALRYPGGYRLASIGETGRVITLEEGTSDEMISMLFDSHRHYQDDVDYEVSQIQFENA